MHKMNEKISWKLVKGIIRKYIMLSNRWTQDYWKNLESRNALDYPGNPQKQTRVKTLEKQIDQLVYKLYDLTPEEIQIVEGFNKGK